MKFDCGPSKEERKAARRIKAERIEAISWYLERRKMRWQHWYAWFPVQVGSHDCRWLEDVERRQIWKQWDIPDWEYRSQTS